jgi:diguanylate cyclase (GGDEF)-like protein
MVADAMRDSVRETDICARLGGDEFLVFAASCDLDSATEIARRILNRVFDGQRGPGPASFSVSIGICVDTQGTTEFETMYRCADQALYRAKAAGKNCYAIYDPATAA